jgi:hypothetical protein
MSRAHVEILAVLLKHLLAFMIFAAPAFGFAEDKPAEAPIVGPVEATFKSVEKPWLIAGVLEFPFYWFYLGGPSIKGEAYLPNFLPRLGARVVRKDMGAMLTVGLPIISKTEERRRGKSKQAGVSLNTYWRQNAFDVYYQHFKGFYVSDPFTELSANKPSRYPQMPDTSVTNVGLNWYHAWNAERYSLKAAFDQNEFQLQSGGSWILNPFFNHLEMYAGSRVIPGSHSNFTFPNLASGRFDSLGMAVGYGYTYVNKKFFATLQGTTGPGLQFQRIRRTIGDDSETTTLAAKLNTNIACGWNYTEYVGGLKVLVDSLSSRIVDTQVTSSMISIQLFYGERF